MKLHEKARTGTEIGIGGSARVWALGLQPDGKIVAAGEANGSDRFALVRYEAGPGLCGNGFVDPGEVCDDGGESGACDADCTLALCGDTVPNAAAGEDCDPGTPGPSDCCTTLCAYSVSGASCEDGLECTYADACDGAGGCITGGPSPCIGGFTKATMILNERMPGRELVKIKLKNGPLLTKADFGNPKFPGDTSYRMCFFDDAGGFVGESPSSLGEERVAVENEVALP